MDSLEDTYEQPSRSLPADGPSVPLVLRESPPAPRTTTCQGDVLCVLCGVIILCSGLGLWAAPPGFGGEIASGIQRLGIVTTTLGVRTLGVCGLLLYSLSRAAPSSETDSAVAQGRL